MSWIKEIFEAFSIRNQATLREITLAEVPSTTRTRFILWCQELFANSRLRYGQDVSLSFIQEAHQRLLYRLGRYHLSKKQSPSEEEDLYFYLHECPDEEFLDFIEDIFRLPSYFQVQTPDQDVTDQINEILDADNLPYHLTNLIEKEEESTWRGSVGTSIRVVAYPKIILQENEIIHEKITEPALSLLSDPIYESANCEYRGALEDYRKKDYGDCLTKCNSAFESVIKIICVNQGWAYRETDTARKLVNKIISNTTLEPYFEPLLMIVSTLRNKMSSSHGGGTSPRSVPRHRARYSLNATAAAMLLLVDEVGFAATEK